ncbi:MAG: carboxypeptidase-like regulatory domain-containing protein [Candidatus Delongbacteria bacterium]|nr:carboxypeptidase-like regulatory domain-containing protein [Candidatus Delongbacteria bacterium]
MKYIVLILISITSFLFSGLIKGEVKDNSENPLSEANITIEGTTLGSASNETGYYLITGVKNGTYEVTCSYIGYHPITAVGVKAYEDSLTIVNFNLYPLEMEMEELQVEHEEEDYTDQMQFRKLESVKFYQIIYVPNPDQNLKKPDKVKVGFFERLFYKIGKLFD